VMNCILLLGKKKNVHLLRVFQRFSRKVLFKVNQLVKLRVLKGFLISIENIRENPLKPLFFSENFN